MGKKQTFAKLTEDLEALEKSGQEPEVTAEPEEGKEEPKVTVTEVPVVAPEVVEPVAVVEEPVVEEPATEGEEVTKSAKKDDDKDDEPEDKDKSDDKGKGKKDKDKDKDKSEDKDKEDKKDEEPVKKSAEDDVTEADFLGAFEAVIKSHGGLKAELAEIKKSIADLFGFVNNLGVTEEPVAKSAEPVEEPAEAPVVESAEESVTKSVEQPEEDLEGKSVEYVSKSNGIPEVSEEPVGDEEPVEAEFNPIEHVKTVTDYFMKNAHSLSQGDKATLRGAVNRVKRGEGTAYDVQLFKEISENSGN